MIFSRRGERVLDRTSLSSRLILAIRFKSATERRLFLALEMVSTMSEMRSPFRMSVAGREDWMFLMARNWATSSMAESRTREKVSE